MPRRWPASLKYRVSGSVTSDVGNQVITKVRVGNFKGFRGNHELSLSRLTLVFGPNSSGKSALIHALLLLSQSLSDSSVSVFSKSEPSLRFSGPRVDLGDFSNAVHNHDLERTMSLGITQTGADKTHGDELSVDLQVSWDGVRVSPIVNRFRYRVESLPENDFVLVASEARGPGDRTEWRLSREESGLENLKALLRGQLPSSFEVTHRSGGVIDYETRRELVGDLESSETVERTIALRSYGARGFLPLPEPTTAPEDDAVVPWASIVADTEWAKLLSQRGKEHHRELSSIRHVGPLRDAPARAQVRLDRALIGGAEYVGPSGAALTDVLITHPQTQAIADAWLARLGMPYTITTRTLALADVPSAGTWGVLVLRDVRSGTSVALADVGVGVSQVLPIVVQLALAHGDLVLIEQPELHLHPRAQAELGDLLLDSVRAGNQLFVETHSEHLLLRILRRIRQGTASADDIRVLYVDTDATGASVIKELRVNRRGDFVDEWPNGFFEERLDELAD